MAFMKPIVLSVAAFSLITSIREGGAEAASKEECVDIHSRGQDLKDRGQIVRARQMFLSCAQSSCPSLVQSDCARLGEEVERIVPTVSFSARDTAATDLPNTSVYVDDILLASRLDEGKSYDLDPGKHIVRYVHEGKETIVRVVLNQGEKGRVLLATFAEGEGARKSPEPPSEAVPKRSRSALPLVVAGLGTAAAVTGGVLFAVGANKVPDSCDFATRACAAPPNDPSFTQASNGASLANIGLGVGIGGAVVLATSLVWYFVQPSGSNSQQARVPQPWISF